MSTHPYQIICSGKNVYWFLNYLTHCVLHKGHHLVRHKMLKYIFTKLCTIYQKKKEKKKVLINVCLQNI